MAIVALLKFSQGTYVGGSGRAIIVTDDVPVVVSNANNTSVQSYRLELCYAPPDSPYAIVPGEMPPVVLAEGNGVLSYAFAPTLGVSGCYRFRLTTWTGVGYTGQSDVDIRNICVPTANQQLVKPPYQQFPDPLPLAGSGTAGEKPDELNFEDQRWGWAGAYYTPGADRPYRLLNSLIDLVDQGVSSIAWSAVMGTPTTVAGYGITDALTATTPIPALQIEYPGTNGLLLGTDSGVSTWVQPHLSVDAPLALDPPGGVITSNPTLTIATASNVSSGVVPSTGGTAKHFLYTADGMSLSWAPVGPSTMVYPGSDDLVLGTKTGNVTWANPQISVTAPLRLFGNEGRIMGDPSLSVDDATLYTKGVLRIGGDLSGDAMSQVVSQINGASVPAAGALTTGWVLQATGLSALGYGQVTTNGIADSAVTAAKLAGSITAGHLSVGGTNVVLWSNGSSNSWTGNPITTSLTASSYIAVGGTTGLATTGTIRVPAVASLIARNSTGTGDNNVISASSDLTFVGNTAGTTYVDGGATIYLRTSSSTNKLVIGNATTNIYTSNFQYGPAVSSPTINQNDVTTASATGITLTIQAQNATGTTSTGGTLLLKSGTGTTAAGLVQVSPGGTLVADFATTYVNLYAGGATASTANLIFRARVGSTTAAAIYYNMAPSTASSTNSLMYIDGGFLQFQPTTQTTIAVAGSGTVVIFSTAGVEFDRNSVFWNSAMSAPALKQADVTTASAVGATLTVQAQNATGTTATGGNLALTSGTGTTIAGNTLLQTGGVTRVTVSPTSVNVWVPLLSFDTTVSAPLIAQNDNATASATAQALTIQAQNATGATSVGGALVLKSGTGTTTNGLIRLSPAGTVVADIDTTYVNLYASASSSSSGNWLIRSLVGSPTAVALYANTAPASATASNYLVMYSASGNMYLNPTNTLTITTSIANTVFTSTSNTVTVPLVTFGASVVSPTYKQNDNTTVSATGQTFTVQAQNATGTTATGGNLALTSGTGTTVAGNTLLQTGGTTRITVSPTLISCALPLNVVSTNAVALLGPLATNTTQGTAAWSTTVGALYLGNGSSALAVVDIYNYTIKQDPSGGTTYNAPYQATAAAEGLLTIAIQTTSVTTAPTAVASWGSTYFNTYASAASSSSGNWVLRGLVGTTSQAALYGCIAPVSATNANWVMRTDGSGLWLNAQSTNLSLACGTSNKLVLSGSAAAFSVPQISYDINQTAPKLFQSDNTTASATAQALTVQAQNATGTTATGGDLILTSGTGTTVAGNLYLKTGGVSGAILTPLVFTAVNVPVASQYSAVVVATIQPLNTSTVQGTLSYNSAFGALYLSPDNAPTAKTTNYNYTLVSDSGSGVTQLNAAYSTTGAREGTLQLSIQTTNASTASTVMAKLTSTGLQLFRGSADPASTPASGSGILYIADTSALTWRSASGTDTTLGPAEPHCPRCGADFALEWKNPEKYGELSLCVPCLMRELKKHGVDPSSYAIVNNLKEAA